MSGQPVYKIIRVRAPVAALLISVSILLNGQGLQGTLLPVRASVEAFPTIAIGATGFCIAALYIVINPIVILALATRLWICCWNKYYRERHLRIAFI